MSSKRTRKDEGVVPSKKRHIEENDENVDISNISEFQGESSQVLSARMFQQDPTLKSGKIKKIHLKNFMCHSHFQVNLNKNVNVFVGLNGSGKSAILTALAIGLGSKASSTSRSTSLKDLVKRGESSATIEITLSNDGIDSFEEDVYGKEITIIRSINSNTGASSYKLKNFAGRVISTSRQDLNKLTLCLNIQVENPVLILNQDAARSFLKECDPKKLYELFLKATQIETIIEKLHACLKCAASSKSQLEHLDRSIKQYQSEILVIKEKHEKLKSVAKLRKDIKSYKNELEWLKVSIVERELLEVQKTLTKKREQLAKVNDFVKNKGKLDKELKERIRDFGTQFASLSSVVNGKDQISETLRTEFENQRDQCSEVENIHRNLEERKKQCDQNVTQLETEISERAANPLNVENMRKENELKIQALQKKKEDVGLILATARRDFQQFTETLSDTRDKIDRIKGHQTKIQNEVQSCVRQIQQFEGSKKDALSVYGPSMSQLIKRLDQLYKQRKFAEMPRGPIGRFIEVSEGRFKNAVENVLGQSFLMSFYVSCDRDRLQLTNVFKEFPEFARLQIITGQFHKSVYDVRNGMVQLNSNHGRVLMDVIKVSDPVVMNCLIDQRHIESVVLVESTEIAIELTQDEENVPQNLQRVILLEPLSEYYPAPNYRSYAMREQRARFIQTNYKDVIAGFEEQKRGLEDKLKQIEDFRRQTVAKIQDQEKLVSDKKKLVSELLQKERGYSEQMKELQTVEYPPEDESEFFQKELEDSKKKQRHLQRKLTESEEKLQALKEEMKRRENQWKKSREEAKLSRIEMTKMQAGIESAQQQLNEMNTDIKTKKNQLALLQREEVEILNQEETLNVKIEALVGEIRGERVNSDRDEEVIAQLIRSAEKRIKNIESSNDNIEDVELLLNNKIEQVEKMLRVREVLSQVLKTLENIRQSRFHYIKRLRQHMSLRCKHKFNVLMALRNYSAEVEIDHKEKTLELKVIPRDSQVADAVSNTKSLSGGERSYSTVAFLISLWSCVDHPFYFLDEYDVFSDEHNRLMMTKLLFNEADKKRDKQYGFLTPQDFSNIQASESITIHKLHDPDRMN